MRHFTTYCMALAMSVLTCTQIHAQCSIDFDFGEETLGISPNPEAGEQFAPGVVGQPYNDVLHILIPFYVLEIDSTLPFAPNAPLDSVSLATINLVNLEDTLNILSLADAGLEVVCNNNGDSGNPCSFIGGNQYCVDLEGVPTLQGTFRVDISVNGWVTVFGFPFSQEQVFGSFILDLGEEGCTNSEALNFNPDAVVDDGSCLLDNCTGDLNGDNSVTVQDVLSILAEFGCESQCSTDITGDGLTTVADLLELLSVFGETCG